MSFFTQDSFFIIVDGLRSKIAIVKMISNNFEEFSSRMLQMQDLSMRTAALEPKATPFR